MPSVVLFYDTGLYVDLVRFTQSVLYYSQKQQKY